MRIALFKFHGYYPSGGWNDLQGIYESAEEALRQIPANFNDKEDSYQIVDLDTATVIEEK